MCSRVSCACSVVPLPVFSAPAPSSPPPRLAFLLSPAPNLLLSFWRALWWHLTGDQADADAPSPLVKYIFPSGGDSGPPGRLSPRR